MHYMFLLFITLNGQPVGPTMHIEPVFADCRDELLFTEAINRMHYKVKDAIVEYGSCELVKG